MMSRREHPTSGPRPGPGTRRAVPTAPLALALALGAMACDDMLVDGPVDEAGNVEAVIGAAVVEADTGIVVNGQSVIRYPHNGAALWLDRFERFDFGGFPELDYQQPARYGQSWRIMLAHRHPPEERGDSTIFRYHDHGDAAVAGVPMGKHTDIPHLGPGAPPIRFESFIHYHLPTAAEVEWMHGGSTTFVQTPFHDHLAAGHEILIETTGSDEVLPVQTTFSARPFILLTGLENRGVVDLARSAVPVIHVEDPLVLTFDRPLDAARSYVVLHPMHPHLQPGTRAVFLQTRSPAQRVVIPPHVLRQLVDDAADQTAFRAIIVDILVQDDAFTGAFTDGADTFSLPFVQRAETSVHLYLRR